MTLLWSFLSIIVVGFYKHNAPDGASGRRGNAVGLPAGLPAEGGQAGVACL